MVALGRGCSKNPHMSVPVGRNEGKAVDRSTSGESRSRQTKLKCMEGLHMVKGSRIKAMFLNTERPHALGVSRLKNPLSCIAFQCSNRQVDLSLLMEYLECFEIRNDGASLARRPLRRHQLQLVSNLLVRSESRVISTNDPIRYVVEGSKYPSALPAHLGHTQPETRYSACRLKSTHIQGLFG